MMLGFTAVTLFITFCSLCLITCLFYVAYVLLFNKNCYLLMLGFTAVILFITFCSLCLITCLFYVASCVNGFVQYHIYIAQHLTTQWTKM